MSENWSKYMTSLFAWRANQVAPQLHEQTSPTPPSQAPPQMAEAKYGGTCGVRHQTFSRELIGAPNNPPEKKVRLSGP
jgi:hypothetical protein